ncbi:protein BUD31 homolog 2 [Carica papaya]|uniref:protein BUD31 homolog 2 n=1 Tax=Carica papaya TaxID=3649 RepID=UPI000B8CBF20|nr:protein BUD31 homolog 2 [Carica papaya]
MPKVKTNRVQYPEGWELIEPTLRELQAKMREGCHLELILRIRDKYGNALYQNITVTSWSGFELQPGYERLCCLRCMQPRDHNFATTCVCRVPKHLREEKVIECVHCGCRGCASGD